MNNYRENKKLEIDGQRFCQENGTIRKIELEVQRRKKMKKEEKGMKKMIAKDGKLFDIDNIKKPSKSHQVEIIQYLKPSGKRRRMIADLDDYYAKKSKNLVISCELLPTNKVAFSIRKIDESVGCENMHIYPNNTNVPEYGNNILRKLIDEYGD